MTESHVIGVPRPGVYRSDELRLEALLSKLNTIYGSGKSGALALFLGIARAESRRGREVDHLLIEAYEENANAEIEKICREVREKHRTEYVGIWHLEGTFRPGEPVVLVVVAGPHRDSVFEALRESVERYKREPAIFKKEVYGDGSGWWVSE